MALTAVRVASGQSRELLLGQLEINSRTVFRWRLSMPVRSARVLLIRRVVCRFFCLCGLSAHS